MTRFLIATLNLIVSVAVPLAFSKMDPSPFSTGESYIFGVLLFIALTVFELYIYAERAFATETRVTKIWDTREKLDARLQEVRRLFHEVEEQKVGDPDLFVSYFNKKLADLENSLRDASSKKEVRISETMLEVTTWLVKSSFHGRKTDVFRAVHFAGDNDFFFDVHSKRYFGQVAEMVDSGQIKQVRRLVVVRDNEQLKDPRTQRLLTFHQENKNFSCQVISYDSFMTIVGDYGLRHLVNDFGIYGNSYLYKGVIAKSQEIVGSYSRDQEEIDRFIDCFDTCWRDASRPPPRCAKPRTKCSVDWMFSPDVPGELTGANGPAADELPAGEELPSAGELQQGQPEPLALTEAGPTSSSDLQEDSATTTPPSPGS